MKFGVSITPYMGFPELQWFGKTVEDLGFEYFWLHDYGLWRDVYVSLTLLSLSTRSIKLGIAVTSPLTRHPAVTAAAIASVSDLSSGRAVLGLGIGGTGFILPLGIKLPPSTIACRECMTILRSLFNGEVVDFKGNVFQMSDLALNFPLQFKIPIYLAATGPKMLRLAGELADGVILNVGTDPKVLRFALEQIELGCKDNGRKLAGIDIACRLDGVALSQDPKEAKNMVKSTLPLVVGNAPAAILNAAEVDVDLARRIKTEYYTKGPSAALPLISDDMVDKFAIAGTPDECLQRIKDIQRTGIFHADLTPISTLEYPTTVAVLEAFKQEVMSSI
jgi:5,10-methylenetetrahydromethanopterin reductase